MAPKFNKEYIGYSFQPEVKNVFRLSLAFAKAAAKNQDDKTDNLVLSPYNALMALSMVAKAAGTETRAEMAKTLFNVAPEQLDDEISRLMAINTAMLEANKDQVTLKTANAVWTNSNLLDLAPGYAAALKKEFSAEVSAQDFNNPATVDAINQWASDNTNKLIEKVLEELSGDDLAVLASALYFKGDWTHQFDVEKTRSEVFTNDQAQALVTKMMQQTFDEEGAVRYQEGEDYEAIALTYGKEDQNNNTYPTMRLVLVRPTDENVSATDFLAAQGDDGLPAWSDMRMFENAIGSVRLPHIDIAQKHDLIPVLEDAGIKKAFDSSAADFTAMVDGQARPHISKVSHDVVFKTDEKGSEAAAVTTIIMTLECAFAPPRQIDVRMDRSFVLMLQDVKTGLPLFIGAVNKPNDKMTPARTCGTPAPRR